MRSATLAAGSATLAAESPAGTRPISTRSRTTNRLRLPGLDGRTAVARRFRDLADAYARTVAPDRPLTDDEAAAVLKAASLAAMCESIRAKAMKGRKTDIATLARLEGVADRALRALDKLKRKAPVGPSLRDSLANRASGPAQRAAAGVLS